MSTDRARAVWHEKWVLIYFHERAVKFRKFCALCPADFGFLPSMSDHLTDIAHETLEVAVSKSSQGEGVCSMSMCSGREIWCAHATLQLQIKLCYKGKSKTGRDFFQNQTWMLLVEECFPTNPSYSFYTIGGQTLVMSKVSSRGTGSWYAACPSNRSSPRGLLPSCPPPRRSRPACRSSCSTCSGYHQSQ